ncbi:adhesion G protein-coupled receptor F5-like [Ptychodera flava]|uniref:adhesion G protein-coupled receptor F5-like n=1 Tax=Ptychodera flava TaxID=63121 RepID=UPI00396AAF5F
MLGSGQAGDISLCNYSARYHYVCERNATDLQIRSKDNKVNSNVGPDMGECASCMKGFKKQQPDGLCWKASAPDCGNAVRGKECPSGLDDTFQVQWDETRRNCFTKRVPCPTGTRGKMRRYCDADGKWGDVDTINCVSDELSTKLEMAATAQNISDVGEALSRFKERFSTDADIHGGDLNLTVSLLDVIIKKDPLERKGTKEEKEKYILDMIELISALLDEKMASQWIRIRNASGQSIGSPEVLQHLEDFSDSVQTFYSKIGHGTFIRTKNLIYQVLLVSDVTWDLKVPSRSNNSASRERRDTSSTKPTDGTPTKMNSFVILPDELLRELNATIVITYLYENPEDVLPQEPVEPPPREWVKAITATKTVTKLNSQVVSVIVYNDTDTLEISNDVEMTMYHHEVGYNSLCYYIEFEHEEGILMGTGCGAVKVDLVGGYTICKCNILGSFVIKSIMGPKPVPFLEAGKKYALIIASIVAAILILISFILICMSRIDIDRYVVMAQATLAYLFFPVCVLIGLFLNDTQGCRVLSLFVYVEAMSSNAWMLCQILQVFFKVKYYVCVSNRRLLYSILGWVFPIVVATFAYVTASETQGSENLTDLYSCFLKENDAVVSESIFLLFSLINLSLLILTHRMYCKREDEFVWFEKDRLWNDLLIVSLLFPTMIMTWIFGKMTTMNAYFLYTYIFATSLFAFASLIFLGFCATNQELLEAIRVKYFEDQLHREALKEEKLIEIERYKIRNENMKIMRSITEDKVRRRHISKNRNVAIEGIFQTAVHRNRVGVACVSDDIKIEEIK